MRMTRHESHKREASHVSVWRHAPSGRSASQRTPSERSARIHRAIESLESIVLSLSGVGGGCAHHRIPCSPSYPSHTSSGSASGVAARCVAAPDLWR